MREGEFARFFAFSTVKFLLLLKSVDFAAKAVYFVAAHAAQRQNQFDLRLNQFGLRLTRFDLWLTQFDLRLTKFDLRLIKFVFGLKTIV